MYSRKNVLMVAASVLTLFACSEMEAQAQMVAPSAPTMLEGEAASAAAVPAVTAAELGAEESDAGQLPSANTEAAEVAAVDFVSGLAVTAEAVEYSAPASIAAEVVAPESQVATEKSALDSIVMAPIVTSSAAENLDQDNTSVTAAETTSPLTAETTMAVAAAAPVVPTAGENFEFDAATGTINGYLGEAKDIVIPAAINGVPVTAIAKNAFSRDGLTSVTLNEGLTAIGSGAFSGNGQLSNVVFSSTVKQIGDMAFLASGLNTVELNEGLQTIGTRAFSNSTKLTAANLPNSLTTIGNLIFEKTALNGEIVFGTELGHVGHSIYKNGTGTPTFRIEAGAGNKLYLHDDLFPTYITSLTIPQNRPVMVFARSFTNPGTTELDLGVLEIKAGATLAEIQAVLAQNIFLTSGFAQINAADASGAADIYHETEIEWGSLDQISGGTAGSTITLAGKFTPFTAEAYAGVGSANQATTETAMALLKPVVQFKIVENSAFAFDAATGTITGYTGSETAIVIPDAINGVPVVAIGEKAFMRSGLTSVTLNEGLQTIGIGAFIGSSQLKDVQFSSTVKTVADMAFGATAIETIQFNAGLERIGSRVFSNAKALTTVNLPDSLVSIDNYAFDKTNVSGELLFGSQLDYVGYNLLNRSTGEVIIKIADSGTKLHIDAQVLPAAITSLNVPQNREIFISGKASLYPGPLQLNLGALEIANGITREDLLALLAEKVSLTSGYRLSQAESGAHVYRETQVEWLVNDEVISGGDGATINVLGRFKPIASEIYATDACCDEVSHELALANLQPVIQLVLVGDEIVATPTFEQADFSYEIITEKDVTTNAYYAIKGLSASGQTKLAANQMLVLPNTGLFLSGGELVELPITGIAPNAFAGLGLTQVILPEMRGQQEFFIGAGAFQNNQLTAIAIPDGVKTIDEFAFKNNQLTTLTLPGSILKVGNEAFADNMLTELIISDDVSLLQLDNYSFLNNQLRTVEIPYSVFKIKDYVFMNNTGLEPSAANPNYGVVALYTRNPDHLTASTYIFSSPYQKFVLVSPDVDRDGLFKTITYSNHLSETDFQADSWQAFTTQLNSIKALFSAAGTSQAAIDEANQTLTQAVAALEPVAVNKKALASELSRVLNYNPELFTEDSWAGLTAIAEATRNMLSRPDVTQVMVAAQLEQLAAAERQLMISERAQWQLADFIYDGTTIIGYSTSGREKFTINKQLVLPGTNPAGEAITAIGSGAFEIDMADVIYRSDTVESPSGIQSVIIPATVTSIGDNAFRLNNLTAVTLPTGLTYIGNTAFNGNQLAAIHIPDTVTNMGTGAFSLNPAKSVYISKGLTEIADGMFSRNIHLASVVIPEGIQRIGSSAFIGAPLTSLAIPSTVTDIGSRAFSSHRLVSLTLPGTIKNIDTYAFEHNAKFRYLTELILAEGIETIGANAFRYGLLQEVYLPFSLKSLHPNAFKDNSDVDKNPVIVKLYTQNPEHLTVFPASENHQLILAAADVTSLATAVQQAQTALATDAYRYETMAAKAQFDQLLAAAANSLINPLSQPQVNQLAAQLKQAVTTLAGAKTAEDVLAELEAAQAENEKLQQELEAMRQALAAQEAELAAEKADHSSATAESKLLRRELKQVQDKLADLHRYVKHIRSEGKINEELIAQLETDLAAKEAEIERLNDRIIALETSQTGADEDPVEVPVEEPVEEPETETSAEPETGTSETPEKEIEEPKDEPKEEVKEEPKEELKEELKEESKEESKEEVIDKAGAEGNKASEAAPAAKPSEAVATIKTHVAAVVSGAGHQGVMVVQAKETDSASIITADETTATVAAMAENLPATGTEPATFAGRIMGFITFGAGAGLVLTSRKRKQLK